MNLIAPPPIISVAMAVYNGGAFVKKSVASILNQTIEDFEFIIIDDGSDDGTGEWLEDLASADSRIRLIRQDNLK